MSEVKKMENKKAMILVLAIAAAVLIAAGGAYAMGRQTGANGSSYPSFVYSHGMGPSMMGGFGGSYGGMMGNHGMAGTGYGQPMMESMEQYMWQYWNSTTTP